MRTRGYAAAALLTLVLVLDTAVIVHAGGAVDRVVVSLTPGPGGWRVEVRAPWVSCSGVVEPAPAFREARTITHTLLVAPFYYVLSSACGDRVAALLEGLRGSGAVELVLEAPRGYVARSALDWRGYGPLGGPYRVPGAVLARFYLYDGIAVVDGQVFDILDLEEYNMSVLVWRGSGVDRAAAVEVAEAAAAARGLAGRVLGPSPRSPVAAVILGPGAAPLLVPGTAWSMGGLFVAVAPRGVDRGWLVHAAAHEAVHGWFNDGLVYGDFSVSEAVVEWLAFLALNETGLAREAAPYIGGLVDTGDPYGSWMLVHGLLWVLSEELCGGDNPYEAALRSIFREAVSSREPRLYSFLDVASRMASTSCGRRVLMEWARLLPALGAATPWSLHSLAQGVARGLGTSTSRPQPAASAAPAWTVTVTTTVTVTRTRMLVETTPGGCGSASSPAGPRGSGFCPACLVLLVAAVLAAALRRSPR